MLTIPAEYVFTPEFTQYLPVLQELTPTSDVVFATPFPDDTSFKDNFFLDHLVKCQIYSPQNNFALDYYFMPRGDLKTSLMMHNRGFCSGLEYYKLFKRYAINLCLPRPTSAANDLYAFYGKILRIFACGGFALCPLLPDFTAYFGDHISASEICFQTKEELTAKINYYLTHTNERLKCIAEIRKKIFALYPSA